MALLSPINSDLNCPFIFNLSNSHSKYDMAPSRGIFQFISPSPLFVDHRLQFRHGRLLNLLLTKRSLSIPPPPSSTLLPFPSNNEYRKWYIHLIQRCSCIRSLKKLHFYLIVNRKLSTENDQTAVAQELIRSYIHLGHPQLAVWVYRSLQKSTLALMNSTIRCLCDHEFYGEILSFYSELQQATRGCHSDNFTFPFVIKAAATLSDSSIGKEIHCRALRSGYESNPVVSTSLMDMYVKTGRVEDFQKVFDGMSSRDLVSWNAFLSGFSLNGLHREAFEVFKRIMTCGFTPSASTLLSVISVCRSLGSLDHGKCFHGLALKTGALCTLIPTLIAMYAGCEDLKAATVLFEMIDNKDVTALNAMVSAYAQNGKNSKAFEAFQKMHHENLKPTLISFIAVLPTCGDFMSSKLGESVHACGIKYGFMNKVPVTTSLLSMYAKMGELDAAKFLFTTMAEKNLLAWNSMISGFVLNGQWLMALNTFREMQVTGPLPDAISMISVLSAYSKLGKLHLGRSVHASILRFGLESNHNVMNGLMTMYISCGRLTISLEIFEKMQHKNLSSWNTLISGSIHLGEFETSIKLFSRMQSVNIRFDVVTMISILPAFNRVEDLEVGMAFHGHAIETGCCSDISLLNALISMYMNCSDLESGYSLFKSMAFKDVVSWNVVMTGFRNHNLAEEVIFLSIQMISYGQRPNSITLLNLLPICGSQLSGKSVHAYSIRNFDVLEGSLLTSIMSMYSKFENLNSCLLLFESADKRNIIVWNTMMSVHNQSGYVGRTADIFREMLESKIDSDHVTILNLVYACAQLGRLDLATTVTAFIVKKGFRRTTGICNSMIDMYARSGSISSAREVFDSIIEKDSTSWSFMINAYGLHGNGEAAIALFSEMKQAGLELDDVVFLGVLSACSHSGLVEQGKDIFRSMTKEHNMVPRTEHLSCLVDLLGRNGNLYEAYDIVMNNPFETTPGMLESLLGACNSIGNVELGEKIARLLYQCEPDKSRSFVMLSNIYAGAGRWEESCRVRSVMDGRGLRKEPGFAVVEVK